jgi:hypothetical protein
VSYASTPTDARHDHATRTRHRAIDCFFADGVRLITTLWTESVIQRTLRTTLRVDVGSSEGDSPGLVWFITGAGKCHYVCVVGTAPLQRHPTVPIFAAGSGFESRKSRLALDHALDPTLQVLLKTTEKNRRASLAFRFALRAMLQRGTRSTNTCDMVAKPYRTGFCRPVDTPDGPPTTLHSPFSFLVSLSVSLVLCKTRRVWGRSRRLGATAPRRSSHVGCLLPTPLLRRCCRSCCRRCFRRRWWCCCRCCG